LRKLVLIIPILAAMWLSGCLTVIHNPMGEPVVPGLPRTRTVQIQNQCLSSWGLVYDTNGKKIIVPPGPPTTIVLKPQGSRIADRSVVFATYQAYRDNTFTTLLGTVSQSFEINAYSNHEPYLWLIGGEQGWGGGSNVIQSRIPLLTGGGYVC
jgi:hypothetical protein